MVGNDFNRSTLISGSSTSNPYRSTFATVAVCVGPVRDRGVVGVGDSSSSSKKSCCRGVERCWEMEGWRGGVWDGE